MKYIDYNTQTKTSPDVHTLAKARELEQRRAAHAALVARRDGLKELIRILFAQTRRLNDGGTLPPGSVLRGWGCNMDAKGNFRPDVSHESAELREVKAAIKRLEAAGL